MQQDLDSKHHPEDAAEAASSEDAAQDHPLTPGEGTPPEAGSNLEAGASEATDPETHESPMAEPLYGGFERKNMAWPPASWERPHSAWRSDLWAGPELLLPPVDTDFGREPAVEAAAARRARYGNLARELGETVLLTLLIFFGIRLVVQNFKIEGMSMEPSLHDGQYLLVNKMAYMGAGGPQRGDVIVFESWTPGKDFIKRVIGVPGERVEIRDDGVWINGEKLDEPYLDQAMYGRDEVELGQDEYYVMGDNRGNSSDSRNHGPLDGQNIIGKAWIIYWPLDTSGRVDDAHEVFGATINP